MPSSYTAPIYDGEEMSGKDFIMRCARQFGATVQMQDLPLDALIPEAFHPSAYYQEQLYSSVKMLDKLKGITIEEAQDIVDKDYEKELKSYKDTIARKAALKARLEKTLAEVEAWEVPTPEHEQLKEFSINQILDTIRFDCIISESYGPPVKPSPEEYLKMVIDQCNESIEYYKKAIAQEQERFDKRNQWLKDLRESLK